MTAHLWQRWTYPPPTCETMTSAASGSFIDLRWEMVPQPPRFGLVRDRYRTARRWLRAAASILDKADVQAWHVLSPFDDDVSETMTPDEAALWCCLQAAQESR